MVNSNELHLVRNVMQQDPEEVFSSDDEGLVQLPTVKRRTNNHVNGMNTKSNFTNGNHPTNTTNAVLPKKSKSLISNFQDLSVKQRNPRASRSQEQLNTNAQKVYSRSRTSSFRRCSVDLDTIPMPIRIGQSSGFT